MTEGKGYCHRRLRRIKQEQLQKDLEDLEKGKIVAITNQRKRKVKNITKKTQDRS